MNRRQFAILSACTVSLGPLGCRKMTADRATAIAPVQLTLSIAASLQVVMQSVQAAYRSEPKVAMVYNFGASGSLAQQIVQGAPVDIFLSASPDWMDVLNKEGLLAEGSRRNLLKNSLVLVTPKSDSRITGFKSLEAPQTQRIAIGEPESVPVGKYAKESLEAMNLFESLRSKLVLGKDVRQVLAYVETGSVEAGFVYATDALTSDKVRTVATVPDNAHSPILYPVAAIKSSQQVETALSFMNFLGSDAAVAIFKASGFDIV